MKKMLCLLLALLLCPVGVLAEDSAAEVLTYAELTEWAGGYILRAMNAEPLNDPAQSLTAEGYEHVYDFATLYADAPIISGDTAVSAVVLNGDNEQDPRGLTVSCGLEQVLAAYYSENPALEGSRETAVLYAVDRLPEAALWGQVNRDGQRVQTVQYGVHEQLPSGGEGYSDAGVIYTMVENRVAAIRVYGLDSRISVDAVNDVMYNVLVAALAEDYAQVPFSYVGADLSPFGAEDLTFSGIDFLALDGETAIALLGEPMSDKWMENDDLGWIRVQRYADCELTCLYDQDRTQGRIYKLTITADGLEGPRAVRVGDTFSSVYNRFRNGEGAYQEDGAETLYGDESQGAFGTAEYGYDASATLRYGFLLGDGRKVVLKLEFTVMELTSAAIYVE